MVKLPLKTLVLWRARLSAVCLLLCVALARFLYILLPAIVAVYLLLLFWYLPAFFKSFEITLKTKMLILRYGVVLCRQRICYFEKPPVIYAFSTPLARALRLELTVLRTTYGLIALPETEYGRLCENVQV